MVQADLRTLEKHLLVVVTKQLVKNWFKFCLVTNSSTVPVASKGTKELSVVRFGSLNGKLATQTKNQDPNLKLHSAPISNQSS